MAPGQPHTAPGPQLFGDPEPLFGEKAPQATDATGGAHDGPAPDATMRPGEFGLPSAPERPPEPKVVRPSVIPGNDKPSRGNGSGPSRTLIWSGVAAAVLLVLAGGWYFLLRDDGSDGEAASSVKPTVAAETTVSTEQQPTSTTEPLPTKPTIAPGERLPPLEFSGTGDSTVVVDPPGPRVARVDYTGTGPFVLKGLDANGGEVATLVESDGPYSGSVAVDFRDEQDSRSLSIEGAGGWSIRMVPVESLIALPGQFKGSGDNVVLYTGGIGPVALSHSGTGPFKVNYFEIKTRKISTIADENGPFEGTAELRGPAFVWITADGLWSVTPG